MEGERAIRRPTPRAPPMFGRPVLPPIPNQEYQLRHRHQGTSNPSFISHEESREPPPYTTVARRELPKTPAHSSSQINGVHNNGRRHRADDLRSASARYDRRGTPDRLYIPVRGDYSNHYELQDHQGKVLNTSQPPDVAFMAPQHVSPTADDLSPGSSNRSGSKSPKLESRSSGSRSAEPHSPLIRAHSYGSSHEYDSRRHGYSGATAGYGERYMESSITRPVTSTDIYMEPYSRHVPEDEVFKSTAHYVASKKPQHQGYKGSAVTAQQTFNLVPKKEFDLHVVFDIFTHNPLDVPMSPSCYSENCASQQSLGPYWSIVRTYQQNGQFLEGMLLRSVTPEGDL